MKKGGTCAGGGVFEGDEFGAVDLGKVFEEVV